MKLKAYTLGLNQIRFINPTGGNLNLGFRIFSLAHGEQNTNH
jgi:hypothetical protein